MKPTIYQVVQTGDKANPKWDIHQHQGDASRPTGYSADTEGGAIRLAGLLQSGAELLQMASRSGG